MDALGGYGSDSSSSDNHQEEEKPKNALSSLLGAASDDDNDANDSSKDDNNQEALKSQLPPSKRQRLEEKATPTFSLPSPPLGGNSMIHWDVNFLKGDNNNITDDCTTIITPATKDLQDKLERLTGSIQDVSWADHLKAQQEFHNPHFFESVVEHFGIAVPLGSQMEGDTSSVLQPYELDLFPSTQQS
jgi:hypothetical protein